MQPAHQLLYLGAALRGSQLGDEQSLGLEQLRLQLGQRNPDRILDRPRAFGGDRGDRGGRCRLAPRGYGQAGQGLRRGILGFRELLEAAHAPPQFGDPARVDLAA
ncbi:MAG: hypothetical protein AB7S98_03525 [Burkholderiaceae bacterium]